MPEQKQPESEQLNGRVEEKQGKESKFRLLFDESPVALWEEDFSKVKVYIDELRESGVSDFRTYFKENVDELKKCADLIQIVRVNRATLLMQNIESENELIGPLGRFIQPDAYDVLAEEIAVLAEGKFFLEKETVLANITGGNRTLLLRLSVPEGSRETLDTVIISMLDISDAVEARTNLERERRAYHIIAEAAVNPASIPELCLRILSGLVETLDFDQGTVRLYEEDTNLLRVAAIIGIDEVKIKPAVLLDDPDYIIAKSARERKTLYISDTSKDPLIKDRVERVKELDIRTVIFWPILGANDSLLGVINISSSIQKEIASIDKIFFETVAGMFATVLEERKAQELLRESDERFNLFADNLPGPVYIKDHESRVIYVNRYMLGMTEGSNWMGQTNYDLFPPDIAAKRTEEDKEALAKGPVETIVKRPMKDGSFRFFRTTKFPIPRKEKPPLLGGFSIDITDLKETETDLSDALSRLEFLNDLMAHDLSNMQQGIMASLELMIAAGTLPDELHALAEGALKQTKRGVTLIGNVKKLSRVDIEDRELVEMDPYPFLMSSIEIVQNSFPNRSIRVTTNLEREQFIVLADDFLVDVFYNLLHNSARLDVNDEVLIDVIAKPSDDGDFLQLRFEDRGPGISDTQKDVVFTRMEDKAKRGSGLGLTLVKRIVTRYDGKIDVEDRVNGTPELGICFAISIPMLASGTQKPERKVYHG